MRYLIVNADDFGASPGINRGILEAHTAGILTSTSLMVDTPWSAAAASMGRLEAALSVGLHVVLPEGPIHADTNGVEGPREALERQYQRFVALMGGPPTHVDSHHNVHRDPVLLASFLEFCREHALPLREHSPVRYFSKFYGRWGGESHPEQVSVESLARMLATEIGEGITELSCHPGYVDARAPSGYALEREAELRTLCDPRMRPILEEQHITLVSYHDLGRLAGSAR